MNGGPRQANAGICWDAKSHKCDRCNNTNYNCIGWVRVHGQADVFFREHESAIEATCATFVAFAAFAAFATDLSMRFISAGCTEDDERRASLC